MDITQYFSQNNIVSKNTGLYRKLLSDYVSEKKINLLEHSYLTQFLKDGGTIVNLGWFIDISKKINDNIFNDECQKIFENLITVNNNEICPNNKGIIKELTFDNEFNYSNDQQVAIEKIINFLINYQEKTFGLYGYAGTGKTTTIVELTSFLIKKGFIKSIAYTAPTNKAVNIIKAKFRNHLKEIVKIKTNIEVINNSMDELLDILYKKGVKIEFITIHRLLNYKNDFDADGEKIFIQKGETNIKDYQLVIIDECSMIPFQIINHLYEDIRQVNRHVGNNYKKIPKLLFTGDRAQLNAVNELSNVLFDIDRNLITSYFENMNKTKNSQYMIIQNETNNKIQLLESDIKNMKIVIMKEVMRSKVDNIVNLCINIRQWLEKEIKYPQAKNYVGNGVSIYKYDKKYKKTDSSWFKKYLANFNNIDNTLQTSNIILTWTNKQCNDYNDTVRKIIFKHKKNIEKYEVGDILMLNDFYNIDETKISKDNKNRFYTSEQIKVMEIEKTIKKTTDFVENSPTSLKKMKNYNNIDTKFKNIIKTLNSKTKRTYAVWKLYVNRLTDTYIKDTINETYQITVINDSHVKMLNDEKILCADIIKNFRKSLISEFRDQIKTIDRTIIRQLWRDWSRIFIEPFAKVNYGCSITTHKSQSSTYINAFIDVHDILLNNSDDEAKRCLYTALTRASNEVHLLV